MNLLKEDKEEEFSKGRVPAIIASFLSVND
jgi:hypothetical protein